MRKCSILLAVSLLALISASFSSVEQAPEGFPESVGRVSEGGSVRTERVETRPTKTSTTKTSLLFTGDILLDRGVRRFITYWGADALFSRSIDSLFATSNVVVGNLECPATRISAPMQKRFIFRADPEHLSILRKHGITHLNLCNNHSIDQGREGLMDTKKNVEKAGMVPVGAGHNMDEASKPVLLAKTPRKVWLLTSLRLALEHFTYLPDRPCVSQEPMDTLLSRISRLRKAEPRAVIIVSLHWGAEHTLRPVPRQRLEAHRLIDAGADALVCHHTHTLQTVENYRGRPIYYSIGNFIFDQTKPENSQACAVKIEITKDAVNTHTIPIVIRKCVPHISNAPSAKQ